MGSMKFIVQLNSPKRLIRFLFARFYSIRMIYSFLCHLNQSRVPPANISLFKCIDIECIVSSLKSNGLYRGLKLPDPILHELLEYAKSNNCYAGGNPLIGFNVNELDSLNKKFREPFYMAEYFNTSEQCPAISKIINDLNLKEIVSLYVGKNYKFTGSSFTWIFPVAGKSYDSHRQESTNFHYDIDDFSSVRIFFYLTDVTKESGPHVCVKGSHIKKPQHQTLCLSSRKQNTDVITKFYDSENIIQIFGEAGYGFIEDTFCFHKGTVPRCKPRLMLQLHFAVNNYNNGKYSDYQDTKILKHYLSSNLYLTK